MTTGTIPAPLVIPNCVEVVLHATRHGDERANVIHYSYSGSPPTSSELAQLAQEVETTIIEEQEDHTSAGTQWYKITAFDLGDPNGAFHERSILRFGVGGSDVLPGQNAFCLSKRSGRRGKSAHGRYYNFDIPKDHVDNDTLRIQIIPSINDQAARLLEPRVSNRFFPCIRSKKLLNTAPMTSITFDFTIDSQDRRTTGRGR